MSDARETLVDLGLLGHAQTAVEEPGGWRPRLSWRTLGRRVIRPVHIAVPLIALLLLVSAAQAAPADPIRFVARVPGGLDATLMVEGSTLFVYDTLDPASAITSGSNVLTAYATNSGRRLWTAVTVEVPELTTMRYFDGLVVLSMVDTDLSGEHTVAFDAVTGRRAWASDLGFATPAVDGILVKAANRPPGFNFPGTPITGAFRLLDPRTGAVRWSVPVPDNCLTYTAGPTATAPVTTLAELCLNTSTLTVVDLATGHVTAQRRVDLGDPSANFLLPVADRMAQPQLTIVGDTVLVAHANAPQPTMDGYSVGDLRPSWSGVPVTADADVEPCGTYVCVYYDAAGLSGTIVDPVNGRQLGAAPERSRYPADGSLVLLGVDHANRFLSTVPRFGAGVSTDVLELQPATATPQWLATWHADIRGGGGSAVPMRIMTGVGGGACKEVASLFACRSGVDEVTVWRVVPAE